MQEVFLCEQKTHNGSLSEAQDFFPPQIVLRGVGSPDEYFFNIKNQINQVLFVHAQAVFTCFACLTVLHFCYGFPSLPLVNFTSIICALFNKHWAFQLHAPTFACRRSQHLVSISSQQTDLIYIQMCKYIIPTSSFNIQ